jgi:hypothetical protein
MVKTMNDITKKEKEWQAAATAAAIAAARKMVSGNSSLMVAHVGRLSDTEWGWIITAAILAWIQVRHEQGVADEWLEPGPGDAAAIRSMLSELADTAGIDWSLSLQDWSTKTMVDFLLLAQRLTHNAKAKDDWDGRGDPIPFDP